MLPPAAGLLDNTVYWQHSAYSLTPSTRSHKYLFHVRLLRIFPQQEPASRGVDTEGIDARGGPDTAGIYGFAREIVEKEEAQAPFRRLRLIGYAVPAFVSAPERRCWLVTRTISRTRPPCTCIPTPSDNVFPPPHMVFFYVCTKHALLCRTVSVIPSRAGNCCLVYT